MEKMWVMLVFVFLMIGVSAAEEVDCIGDDSGLTDCIGSSGNIGLNEGEFYTDNFYIFLGLIVLFVFIVVIFAWFWFRSPVNKWKK